MLATSSFFLGLALTGLFAVKHQHLMYTMVLDRENDVGIMGSMLKNIKEQKDTIRELKRQLKEES